MKYKKKIITAIFILTAAVLCIEMRLELSYLFQKTFVKSPKEIILSEQEKAEDIRYFLDTVLEYSPCMEHYAENNGFDLKSNYDYYIECAKKTGSNEDFFAVIEMISEDIPSCHTSVVSYGYDPLFSSGHYNAKKVCASKDAYAVSLYWDSVCSSNADIGADESVFRYIDGSYLAYDPAIFGRKGGLIELIEIDDTAVDEYIKQASVTGEYCYDKCNDKLYRFSLRLNNSAGTLVTAKFRRADGETFTADTYIRKKDSIAHRNVYLKDNPDLLEHEECAAAEISFYGINELYSGEAGYVCEDTNNSVSYIRVTDFSNSDGKALRDGIAALDSDAPIILDLRMNSGGRTEYLSEYVLSPLMSKECRVVMDFRSFPSTRNLLRNGLRKEKSDFENAVIKETNEYLYGRRYFDVNGTSKTARKIYAITDRTVCSAADTAAYAIRKYGNGILIGSETGGEGVCDAAYTFQMPNSGIIFEVNGSQSLYSEGNCTAPDIYINQSAESFVKFRQCLDLDTNISDYPYRLYWDNVLIETLEIIKEKENSQ